jgi:hypothetical protein
MPSFFAAAAVTLPFVAARVWAINFFSVCAQHRQRTNQTLEQTQGCLPD